MLADRKIDNNIIPGVPVELGEAMMMCEGEERQQKLKEVADVLRLEMEALSLKLKDLVLSQPPTELLGYLWSCLLLGAMHDIKDENAPLQLAMEYVHAVLSSFDGNPNPAPFGEQAVTELLDIAERLRNVSLNYCMVSSTSDDGAFGEETGRIEFFAKTTWVSLRGQRYQQLEGEFLHFVLTPHDEAFRRAYGIGADEVANGIQAIADSMRTGFSDAAEESHRQMDYTYGLAEEHGISLKDAIKKISVEQPALTDVITGAFGDLFHGGICNLSRHTTLPVAFLEDLSFSRGENTEFYQPGPFCGTPLRTLPARIKPLIQLQDGFYATDPNFVRDAAYRAIQRGLLIRLPDYREEWKRKQTTLTESAFPTIFANQLRGATVLKEVYYRDVASGQWVENDTLILLDDVMVQIEAKGGVAAMHSPATNFQKHVRSIQDLVVKAYRQTKRFIDYLNSVSEVPLYELREGNYVEVRRLRLAEYRLILPIGLTVENFSPFSTMCKELPEIQPLLGKHAYISMSIDDLFVLTRFLPTAGELFHYLEVRQAVAGIKKAHLFDELDHLGAYISKNRFDQNMLEQFAQGANEVTWDAFSDVIDKYFEKDNLQTEPPPSQDYPVVVKQILEALNHTHAKGWLRAESVLRNLGGDARSNLADRVRTLLESLRFHPVRWFVLSGEVPILFWLYRNGETVDMSAIIHSAEVATLAVNTKLILVIGLAATLDVRFVNALPMMVKSPSALRVDYSELLTEARESISRTTRVYSRDNFK